MPGRLGYYGAITTEVTMENYIGKQVLVDGETLVVDRLWSETPERTYVCKSLDGTISMWLYESEVIEGIVNLSE